MNFFQKMNKRNCILVQSYYVINLLNYLVKVVEKLIAEQLSKFYEINEKLHKRQIKIKKH